MEKEVFVLKEDKKVLEVELMICGDFGYVGELLIDQRDYEVVRFREGYEGQI